MHKEQGLAILTSPDGVKECSTFTCARCSRVVHVKPRCAPEDLGGVDYRSGRLICSTCVNAETRLWEERVEFLETEIERSRFSGGVSEQRFNEILRGRF
jgi:hypothetical protein